MTHLPLYQHQNDSHDETQIQGYEVCATALCASLQDNMAEASEG